MSVDLDRARREGQVLTFAEAVTIARRLLARTTNSPVAQVNGGANRLGLSPREASVLGLLAEGCSNQEISQRLFVSVKTVERHLGNLYRKLDVANRTQAAAYAIRHGVGTAPS